MAAFELFIQQLFSLANLSTAEGLFVNPVEKQVGH